MNGFQCESSSLVAVAGSGKVASVERGLIDIETDTCTPQIIVVNVNSKSSAWNARISGR